MPGWLCSMETVRLHYVLMYLGRQTSPLRVSSLFIALTVFIHYNFLVSRESCIRKLNRLLSHEFEWFGYQYSRICPWDSPGKNAGEGNHALLQGIFQTQGSNPSLLHCRQILYCLSLHLQADSLLCISMPSQIGGH